MSLFIPGVVNGVYELAHRRREYSVLFAHTAPNDGTRIDERICLPDELELEQRIIEGSTEGWERVPSSIAWVQLKLPKSEAMPMYTHSRGSSSSTESSFSSGSGSRSGFSSDFSSASGSSGFYASPLTSPRSPGSPSSISMSPCSDPLLTPLNPRWARTLADKRRGDTILVEGETGIEPRVIGKDWRRVKMSELEMIHRGELEMRYDMDKRMMYLQKVKKSKRLQFSPFVEVYAGSRY